MKSRLECIDVGSEYCPCYLAETNNCLTCSMLQGEGFCDCNWRGICVYSEYVMNGNKRKEERQSKDVKVVDIKSINKDIFVLKIQISKELSRQLKEPGSYGFLRGKDLPAYFDAPMSIMDVDDEGYVYVAYKVLGSKTKKIQQSTNELLFRGPYWNGLYGMKNLKKTSDKNCLVVARGIAQAPAVLVIKKLVKNGNNVTFIVDRGMLEGIFIKENISGLNIKVIEEDVTSEKGKTLIKDILKNEDIGLIYSGGSELLHKSIINMIDEVNVDPYIVITNNTETCCGEGICGGCSIRLTDGSTVKTCKTQLEARTVIGRRVRND